VSSLDHLPALRAEVQAFHASVGHLDAAVPGCPQWRVRDLVHHVGSVHRLFRRVAEEDWMQRPPPVGDDDRPSPDAQGITVWARSQGQRLVQALGELDPTEPRWNFTTGPQVAAFIPRRMLHETAVHRWDLQQTYGVADPIATAVARDGVEEYLEVQVGRSGPWPAAAATLRIAPVGADPVDVVLRPGQAAVLIQPRSSGDRGTLPEPDAVVAGPAEPLLLALWGRRSLLAMTTGGDRSLVSAFRRFART
jgi:uncharacterized protein (TIGR03083 family)